MLKLLYTIFGKTSIVICVKSTIGLSIAQAIASLHGGTIEVRNTANESGENCVRFSVAV
ncbi:hypothetical protein [uncultured Treponema sp.]|uniref:hypothetical protein n=1 Tax=uncultured Treponema sp. TaxID=162155 RepID=UPI00261ED62F|nr:hypothetical protein [uncultured Treponema sp.]